MTAQSRANSNTIGGHSEVDRLKRVVVRHPRDAFVSQRHLDNQWRDYGYTECPDYLKACDEYDQLQSLLESCGVECLLIDGPSDSGIDSIYVRDSAIITDRGAILCNMGKPKRQSEPAATGAALEGWGLPIVGQINAPGCVEGGDLIWVDQTTLAVGRGYRTNDDGIRQLQALTAIVADEVVVVHLPHWDGPDGLLHLMSLISPIDHDLAAVYSRLLPVAFRQWLITRGITLVEVPDTEFESMGCNILTVAPRKCIVLSGNPATRALLEREGVEVLEYTGNEISLKGLGGPTCLTRPVLRVTHP